MGFFKRHRFPLLTALLLLVAFSIFSVHAGKEPRSTLAGRFFLEVLGPMQKAVSFSGKWFEDVWLTYFSLVNVSKKNADLTSQVLRMRQELTDLEELKLENQRLRSLLGLSDRLAYPTVAASVIAADPSNHFRTAIIDKGGDHGVKELMPVVQSQGVVGRVIWSSAHYSKVLLLTDPNAAVDVLIQRNRTRGIVEGSGRNLLRLKYFLRNHDVSSGDRLITSGSAGVFPKGILVGTVQSVHRQAKEIFQDVEVSPAVDFTRLEEVFVILHRRELP